MPYNHLAAFLKSGQPGSAALLLPSGRVVSHGALWESASQIATVFLEVGVKRGDRVAAQIYKSVTGLAAWLAAVSVGAAWLPLNPDYTVDETSYVLTDAEPRVVICQPESVSKLRPFAEGAAFFTLDKEGVGTLSHSAQDASQLDAVECGPEDTAAVLYTSGTTGKPKGVMLSHGNIVANSSALVERWRFTNTDTLLHALPMFHIHGIFVGCTCSLGVGACMVFLPRFDAAEVVQWLPKASVFMGVPTYYSRLMEFGFDLRIPKMRLFVCGSAPLRQEMQEAWEEKTGHRIMNRYGMTETGIITSHIYDGSRSGGSVGVPLVGVELRIVDADVDGHGHIEVRGPNVFRRYWRSLESPTCDGWFRTGDIGQQDEKGELSITGRAKDIVITGGMNVWPVEVEREITTNCGVESAVVGVPHSDLGEAVLAVVVAGKDFDAVASSRVLRGKLAGYKVPKGWEIVAELPRNTMGKVQKTELRRRYERRFVGSEDDWHDAN